LVPLQIRSLRRLSIFSWRRSRKRPATVARPCWPATIYSWSSMSVASGRSASVVDTSWPLPRLTNGIVGGGVRKEETQQGNVKKIKRQIRENETTTGSSQRFFWFDRFSFFGLYGLVFQARQQRSKRRRFLAYLTARIQTCVAARE